MNPTIVLAILAVALATLPAPALAADDSDDDTASQTDIDELADEIKDLASSLRTLRTTVDGLISTAATINTNVSDLTKYGQVAVIMSKPHATYPASRPADTHLLGSSIPDFPAGTVAADRRFTDRKLPAGTYLFELSNPAYSDNIVCHGAISRRHPLGGNSRFKSVCPRVWVVFRHEEPRREERLDDGFGVFTSDGTGVFWIRHQFPTGWSFEDKPAGDYTGALKITRLK